MKLSAPEARLALLLKTQQSGKRCFLCKRIPAAKVKDPSKQVWRLILHHVDDNNENNPIDGSNHEAACDSCNLILRKPYKHTKGYKYHKNWKEVLNSPHRRRTLNQRPAQMQKAEKAYPFFADFLERTIAKLIEVDEDSLIDAAAKEFFEAQNEYISQETLGTYLDRLCNRINGNYERFQKDKEWWVRKRPEQR